MDKNYGDPIFGITTGKTESMETEQRCDCARNYYEGLEQGCKMTIGYAGDANAYKVCNA